MEDPGKGPGGPNPPPPPPSLSEGLDLPLRKAYEVTAARTSGRVNFSFSRQTGFSHPFFFIKPMVVTEPTVPSTRPLSLGLKLYPSNMQRMRNEDLTRFMHSLS